MPAKYKLYGFQSAGWAEPIRYILSYAPKNQVLPSLYVKCLQAMLAHLQALLSRHASHYIVKHAFDPTEMPFGFLPVLEFEGTKYRESIAICRFLAREAQLRGVDGFEDLQIDSVVDSIRDMVAKLPQLRHETNEKKKKLLKSQLQEEIIPFYMKRFEEATQNNNGYLVIGRLTWADLYLACLLPMIDTMLNMTNLDKYPGLEKLKKKVEALPGIKNWLETRPKTAI